MNVQDPENPKFVKEIHVADQLITQTLSSNEQYLILSAEFQGIFIFDVSNPENPVLKSNLVLPKSNFAAHVSIRSDNQIAFVGAFYGIFTVSLKDITNPTIIGFTQLNYTQHYETMLIHNDEFLIAAAD